MERKVYKFLQTTQKKKFSMNGLRKSTMFLNMVSIESKRVLINERMLHTECGR